MPSAFRFRERAHEVSRLEAFSDVVFGFALTLIVVSLEVPKTYEELVSALRGFPAFALCFAILIWIWHAHYTFSRRYNLHDEFTIAVNSALLFVVLFYVYPLKFLFGIVTRAVTPPAHNSAARLLFTLYGAGYFGIFLFFFLMYRHALQKKEELALNPAEVHDTLTHIYMHVANMSIGALSVLLAWTLPKEALGLAGIIYFAVGIAMTVIGSMRGNGRRKVEAQMAEQAR
jgi:uncharacterized membrane protein